MMMVVMVWMVEVAVAVAVAGTTSWVSGQFACDGRGDGGRGGAWICG